MILGRDLKLYVSWMDEIFFGCVRGILKFEEVMEMYISVGNMFKMV